MRNCSLHGLIIIDKPSGLTSHRVVQRVKKILNVHKAGHTGTLDPFATGVLVIGVNEGTKLAPFLREEEKAYEGVFRLGVETDTLDITGKILGDERPVSFMKEDIERAFQVFRGRILQTPPMYSAIKHCGVPLYRLARAGREIERHRRLVEISELQITKLDLPRVEFRVVCSKGTYVRTLASDIGMHLGCGACLERLRRTKSGDFVLEDAVDLDTLEATSLEEITARRLILPAQALSCLPTVTVSDAVAERVLQGRIVNSGVSGAQGFSRLGRAERFKVINYQGDLLAVAETGEAWSAEEGEAPAWRLLRVFRLGSPQRGQAGGE